MTTKSNRSPALTALIVALATSAISIAWTGTNPTPSEVVFGPQRFLRTSGPPDVYSVEFTAPDSVKPPFVLRVVNGEGPGKHRVSSASIKLNGKELLGSNDCSERVGNVERTVHLKATNTLEVRLTSKPGTYITVTILGTKAVTAPTSIAPNPLDLFVGASGTLRIRLSPAPKSSGSLLLESSAPRVAVVPRTMAFEAGQTTVDVPVQAKARGSAKVSASLNGVRIYGMVNVRVPVNRPPVVDAGESQTIRLPAGATLAGSVTDDGRPARAELTIGWSLTRGPGDVAFADPSSPTTAVTFTESGTYVLRLTASDSALRASDEVTIVVERANAGPSSDPGGPYNGTVGTAIAFHGSGADPDGDPLTFSWDFGDGGTATGPDATHTYASAGTFTVSLTVDDGRGGTKTGATSAVMVSPNTPPHADAGGPYSSQLGGTIAFSGNASSDADGDPLTYGWTFGDGSTATGSSPSHTYTSAATFDVTLTVTDGRGGTHSASTTATVSTPAPVNRPPVARIGGPYSGQAGTPVAFDASASTDPDNDSLAFSWTFGDGGTGTGAAPSRAYAAAGTFTVEVTVSDGRGGAHTASTTAVIGAAPIPNHAPVADAGGPYAEIAGSALNFSAAGSTDTDGDPLTYHWQFGDGASATGVGPSHTYPTAGTYTVTLTVEDGKGGSGSATATVGIEPKPGNRGPTANAGGPYRAEPDVLIAFDGSQSSDPDGDTLAYAWRFGDGSEGTGGSVKHAYAQAGSYTATLTVTDQKGESGTTTVLVTVDAAQDRAPPVITLDGPREALPGTQVTLTARASDNVKVDSVRFDVVGAPPSDVSAPPFTRTIDIPPVASPGDSVLVKATARDSSANTASAEAKVIVVATPDTTPPSVILNAPPRVGRGATLRVSAKVTDTVGVDKVTFTIDGQPTVVASGQPFVATFDVAAVREVGLTIPVLVRGVDFAGNGAQAEAGVLVVVDADTTPPTLSLSAPPQIGIGAILTMTATAQDDTGIASVDFVVEGSVVHTSTTAPFAAQYPVPSSFAPGTILQLRAVAHDFSALEALATATTVVTPTNTLTRSLVTGEAYDDTTGLPLPGVTVSVAGAGEDGQPFAREAISDERGRFSVPAAAGHVVVVISKEGYTRSWRQAVPGADAATEIFDARLTAVGAAGGAISPVLGGTLARDGMSLELGAGALAGAADLRLTWVGQQGIVALLPTGWSPVAAVDVVPRDVAFVGPQSLRAPNRLGIAAGVAVTLARFDEPAQVWRAIGAGSVSSEGALPPAGVEGGGQYAWLVADTEPSAPPSPAAGQPLPAAGPAAVPADATTVINPQPRIIFYKPGVFSDVGSRVAGSSVLQSGAHVLAGISEAYRFFTGTEQHPEPFTQDLVLFQAADTSAIQATHRVTPSLTFEALALELGVITVELKAAAPGDRITPIIGEDGGTVTTPTGEELRVPPGAGGGTVFGVQRLLASELGVGLPQGLNFVGAAAVSFAGHIARSATLSIPRPSGIVDPSRVLLARLQPIAGEDRFVLVAAARLVGDRLESDIALGDNVRAFEGIRVAGRYVFVRPSVPFGFVTGRVLGIDQAVFSGALVTTPTLPLVALSGLSGYLSAGAVGAVPLTATDIVRSDSGSGERTLAAARAVETLDLTLAALAPTVLSVTPADQAQNVPLGSPVVARFSRHIDPASAFGDAVRLTGPGNAVLPGTLVWSLNGTTLTFRPTAALEPNLEYAFTLSTGLRDVTGRGLAAAVVTHFGSLDTNPPPKPAAGTITASIPDANGRSTVRATQGTAGRNDTVSILNVTRKVWTPVVLDPDGGFLTLVEASLVDRLRVRIVDTAGNETFVDLPRFAQTNADGSVSSFVGSEGGKVEGPNGTIVDVPEGAFPDGVRLTLTYVNEAQFPIQLTDDDRKFFAYSGGIKIDMDGKTPAGGRYLNLSLPARGDEALDDSWIVGQILRTNGLTLFNTVDTARIIGGRITTSSPPCPGVQAAETYGFAKSINRPVGTNWVRTYPGYEQKVLRAISNFYLQLASVGPLVSGGGGLMAVMTASNIIGGIQASAKDLSPPVVCIPSLSGRITITPNIVNLTVAADDVLPGDTRVTVKNVTSGAERVLPRYKADLNVSVPALGASYYEVKAEKSAFTWQDLGTTAPDNPPPFFRVTPASNGRIVIAVEPEWLVASPTAIVVQQVFSVSKAAAENRGPEGYAIRVKGATTNQKAFLVRESRVQELSAFQFRVSRVSGTEVEVVIDTVERLDADVTGFLVKDETRVALGQPGPINVSIEGAPSESFTVQLTGGGDGALRNVPFAVTASTMPAGNLILKILPATLDPPVDFPQKGRLRNSVRITNATMGIQTTIPEDAIRNGGVELGFNGRLTDDYELAIGFNGQTYGPQLPTTEIIQEADVDELHIPIPKIELTVYDLATLTPTKTVSMFVPPRNEPRNIGRLSDDTTEPTLLTTAAELADIDPSRPFTLRFSESMDAQSLLQGIFLTCNGQNVRGEIRISDDNRVVTFVPQGALGLGKTCTLSLQVSDVSGNLLVATQSALAVTTFTPALIGTSPEVQNLRHIAHLSKLTATGKRETVVGITRGFNSYRLHTLDVTDPAQPTVVGTAVTSTFQDQKSTWRVHLVEDVSNLALQSASPGCSGASFSGDLAVAGKFGVNMSGVQFFNVTDPASPCLLGQKYLTAEPQSLAFQGEGTLHLPGYAKGVTAIRTPTKVVTYTAVGEVGVVSADVGKNSPLPPRPQREVEGTVTGNYVDVAAIRDHLFAIDVDRKAVDVLTPTLTVIMSFQLREAPHALLAVEGYARDDNANGLIDPAERRDILFVAGAAEISIVDVTDFHAPAPRGTMRVATSFRAGMSFDPSRKWLAVVRADLVPVVLDVSTLDFSIIDDRTAWEATKGIAETVALDPARGVLYVGRSTGQHTNTAWSPGQDSYGVLDVWDLGGLPRVQHVDAEVVSLESPTQLRSALVTEPVQTPTSQDIAVIRPGSSVALTAKAIDSGCKVVTYRWTTKDNKVIGQRVTQSFSSAGTYTPVVTALCDNGTAGPTDDVTVVVTDVVILDRVWSDQQPNQQANYLPGGAGCTGNVEQKILMSTRADGKMYAKARVLYPRDLEGMVRVGLRRVNAETAELDASAKAENFIASLVADPPVSIGELYYQVLVWVDQNEDGRINPDETYETSPWQFRVVGRVQRLESTAFLDAIAAGGAFAETTAGFFLSTFLGVPLTSLMIGSSVERGEISSSDSRLSHVVGALFNSSGKASVNRYVFNSNSHLASQLLMATDLRRAARYELLEVRANEIRAVFTERPEGAEIAIGPFDLQRMDTTCDASDKSLVLEARTSIPRELSDGVVKDSVWLANDFDLHNSFGSIDVDAKIVARAKLVGSEIVIDQVRVSGIANDLYDWDWKEKLPDTAGATVQAGYGLFLLGGGIFESRIYLDGMIESGKLTIKR